jgi:4-diphosphocytidyl-2-C-methyl-D-erythritol kinase
MIRLINQVFALELSNEMMEDYARKLGSDCAFFIHNKPVHAFRKGDVFKPVNIDLSGYSIVIIHPEIHISTPEAYSWVRPIKKQQKVTSIIQEPISKWRHLLINDFEKEVFKRHPKIKEIKDQLYQAGAEYASMSGSGSTVFGLFKNEINLQKNFAEYFFWQTVLS